MEEKREEVPPGSWRSSSNNKSRNNNIGEKIQVETSVPRVDGGLRRAGSQILFRYK
jgi:hypothetical protein